MGFIGILFMLSWMFQHDYLDTYCFECLICMCFVYLYLGLFSAVEHVSHGKVLLKYAHYYYYCGTNTRSVSLLRSAVFSAVCPFVRLKFVDGL